MKNCPTIAEQIYESCVKYNQKERLTIKKINDLIYSEIISFNDLNQFIKGVQNECQINLIIQYIYENVCFLKQQEKLQEIRDYFFKSYTILISQLTTIDEYKSDAFNNLGHVHFFGFGTEQNYEMAKQMYELSSNLNNSWGLFNIGYLYCNGHGVEKDFTKVLEYYQLSAKQNNPSAFNGIGFLYKNGKGVDRDYQMAKKYFELAIKYNNSNALYHMGYLYFNGYGVEKDIFKAKKYFELSAELNNSFGLNALGFMYENNIEIGIDYSKSKDYYEKAAELNNTNSLVNLALLYRDGYGVPKDYLKAKDLLEKAAKKDNDGAFFMLGIFYDKGFGVEKDYKKAKEYYELAIKFDRMDAFNYLGNMYFKGNGVEQDLIKAKHYFEKASKNDIADSSFMLGFLYENGYGVQQNLLIAKNYYELSYKQGNYSSLFKLGSLMINKNYYDVNIQKALKYFMHCTETNGEQFVYEYDGFYNNAYNDGYYPSNNELGLMYLLFNKIYNIDTSIKYFKEALSGEYPFAQNNYGLVSQFYLNKKDDALYFYRKASISNFALAEYNLGNLVEENDGIDEAIQYYINASNHENEKLVFHNRLINDDGIEHSKPFIILLADMKIFHYYFLKHKKNDAKIYFFRILNKIQNLNLNYIYPILDKSDCDILAKIIELNKELLFLKRQIIYIENKINFKRINKKDCINTLYKKYQFENNDLLNHNQVFENFIDNEKNMKSFDDKIIEIMNLMKNILYKSPYYIIFGRVSFKKMNDHQRKEKVNIINQSFYDGFQT